MRKPCTFILSYKLVWKMSFLEDTSDTAFHLWLITLHLAKFPRDVFIWKENFDLNKNN
jgi:hypothetical protein